MKLWIATVVLGALSSAVAASDIAVAASDIAVPQGFRATVVFDGNGPARHLAISSRGDLYISSRYPIESDDGTPLPAILALRDTNKDGLFDEVKRFGTVHGTGIGFQDGYLYATSANALYRYSFEGDELVPSSPPEVIVSGLPDDGFSSRPITFDDDDGVFIAIGANGNICADEPGPAGNSPDPCPQLAGRAGIWRYNASQVDQVHPVDGQMFATGVRDTQALTWNSADRVLYTVLQGRNGLSRGESNPYSEEDSTEGVAEEMHRVPLGANLGWPYAHFDGRTMQRMKAPEYGGGPGEVVTDEQYSHPVAVLPPHSSPLDLVFYHGESFPLSFRNGAFVALQGGFGAKNPQNGYNVWFVPRSPEGGFAEPMVFADGFSGAGRMPQTATYRPSGLAVAPDGALYILESTTGRIWRIDYQFAED